MSSRGGESSGFPGGAPETEPISEAEAREVLERYPEAGSFLQLGRAPDGSSSESPVVAGRVRTIVETQRSSYYLTRRTAAVSARGTLRWRHRVGSHLRGKGLQVPLAAASAEGDTVVEREGYLYELLERPSGDTPYASTGCWIPFSRRDHARSAGEALARFHHEVRDFGLSGQRSAASPGPGAAFGDAAAALDVPRARFELASGPDLISTLERRIASSQTLTRFFSGIRWKQEAARLYLGFHGELRRYLPSVSPWITHGDWRAGTLLFEHERVVGMDDLAAVDVSFRMYDLAVALDRNGILWREILDGEPNGVRFDVVEELLRGYSALLPLTMVEAQLLAALLPIHQLDLAISLIELSATAEPQGSRLARWAYEVYLRDHARHFLTPAGQRMLTFVRHAAAAS
jgi:Ser/Thr protein kinase RdoA (MazF antagonist)